MPDSKAVRVLDGIALSLLLLVVCLAPLPIGSESPWAQNLVFVSVVVAAIFWLAAGVVRGSLRIPRSWCLLFIVFFILAGLLQIIPLPADTVGALSPSTNEMRERALGPEGVAGTATVSLNPYATRVALFHYGACALLFVVLGGVLRNKRGITWAVSLLLAAGLFQAAYAMIDHVAGSGGESVFWAHKKHYASSFSGTFFNKNHFAGFLEMLLPLGVALVLAVRRRRYSQPLELLSDKIAETLSDPATHKRVVLAAIPVVLGIGIVMSMSRSAVVCTAAALIVMLVFAVAAGRRSRGIGTFVAVLLAMAVVVSLLVSGSLIGGFEQELKGGMSSSGKRIDMLRSAWYLVNDFPVLGTGLGTTEDVFGRYQSLNLGNIHVDWLANDWAQIACEVGIIGLAVVGLGLCWFVVSTVRAAMKRHGRYCRRVALGCVTGVVAMVLHSFTDFNLTRTMSNGLLFAALLAVAHAAARTSSSGEPDESSTAHWQLSLGPTPRRLLFALLLIVPLVWLAVVAGKAGVADVRFNYYRHCAGKPAGLYFFLRLPERLPPDAAAVAQLDLQEAVRYCPGNSVYAHALGRARLDEVRRRVADVAEAIARKSHPRIAGLKETSPEMFRQFSRIFERTARAELAAEIAEERLLDGAIADLRSAIRLAPTVGRYHLSLARALSLQSLMVVDIRRHDAADLRRQAEQEVNRTVYFTYNVPYMLFNAAHALLADGADTSGPDREAQIASALTLLKRAVTGAPGELSRPSFELLTDAGVGNQDIIAATPMTVKANRNLSDFFFARKDWADVVTALDRMETAAGTEVGDEAPPQRTAAPAAAPVKKTADAPKEMPPLFEWAAEDHASVQFKLGIARKRASALGYLGQWEKRRLAREKHAGLADERVRQMVAEARTQRGAGHYEGALRTCRSALKLDPLNPEALMEMAAVTSVPHYRSLVPAAYAPLTCLFRAVINNDSLTSRQSADVLALLKSQTGLSAREELIAGFVESVAVILQSGGGAAAGSRTKALHQLQKLAAQIERESILWRQRHLVWHYLGVAFEKRGQGDKAAGMYARAVARVPTHRRSLVALARLAQQRGDAHAAGRYAAELTKLTPTQPCTVTFAGSVRLLGYSIVPADEEKGVAATMRCYWEFLEPPPPGYAARTYLLDYRWRVVSIDRRAIAPESGDYPAELARSGEVIVEIRPLPAKLPNVRYVAFGMRSQAPPKGYDRWLVHEAGGALARFALVGAAGR